MSIKKVVLTGLAAGLAYKTYQSMKDKKCCKIGHDKDKKAKSEPKAAE